MRRLIALCLVCTAPAYASMPGVDGDRAFFMAQVMQEAAQAGVPPELADAVAMVETGYRPNARGSSGEVGIMQILPATAATLGFHGTLGELFEPAVNIHLAVQYLGRAWALSDGNVCRALMKYRAGLAEEVMSPLSGQYCARAISWLMGTGSALATGAASSAMPPAPASADPYVITIRPALAGNTQMAPVQMTPHEALAHARAAHGRADRYADFRARFDSHIRHIVEQAVSESSSDD
jgi:hypothetical protein